MELALYRPALTPNAIEKPAEVMEAGQEKIRNTYYVLPRVLSSSKEIQSGLIPENTEEGKSIPFSILFP